MAGTLMLVCCGVGSSSSDYSRIGILTKLSDRTRKLYMGRGEVSRHLGRTGKVDFCPCSLLWSPRMGTWLRLS